jgi:hypothetical protein
MRWSTSSSRSPPRAIEAERTHRRFDHAINAADVPLAKCAGGEVAVVEPAPLVTK